MFTLEDFANKILKPQNKQNHEWMCKKLFRYDGKFFTLLGYGPTPMDALRDALKVGKILQYKATKQRGKCFKVFKL
jgi:NADPH-dependent glutamate synthase beta subunit-like oxidoreductase